MPKRNNRSSSLLVSKVCLNCMFSTVSYLHGFNISMEIKLDLKIKMNNFFSTQDLPVRETTCSERNSSAFLL